MIHQFLNQTVGHAFDHMIENKRRHDRQSDDLARLVHDAADVLIFQSNYILSIYFQNLMISQQSVTSCRRVLDQSDDFSIFVLETDVAAAVLVQSDGSFEWSIADG